MMAGYIFLVRNGDLYRIGKSNNLEQSMQRIKPDEIIYTYRTIELNSLEARLLRRYKSKRIPDTNYFRLSKEEILDFKKQLGVKGKLPLTIAAEVTISLTASIFLFLLTLSIFIYFKLGLIKSSYLGLSIASLPMWLLFFSGSFGGYDSSDLPLFTSFSNRLKALVLAFSMLSLAYILFKVSIISFII